MLSVAYDIVDVVDNFETIRYDGFVMVYMNEIISLLGYM